MREALARGGERKDARQALVPRGGEKVFNGSLGLAEGRRE
jgi:hypothetical protein